MGSHIVILIISTKTPKALLFSFGNFNALQNVTKNFVHIY